MAKIDHISYGGTNYEIVPAAGDLRDIVAPEFSDQSSYTAGSYVLKNGVLYRFVSAHSGAWTGTDAVKVTIGGELTRLDNGSGSGLTDDIKQALLTLAEKVAYIDEDGQDYYDALYDALYPPAELVSISAVYTQSGTVYDTDTLDSLKPDLVVTAHMSDSTTRTVTTYALSGTLEVGISAITVTYSGKTTTFTVLVSTMPMRYSYANGELQTMHGGYGISSQVVSGHPVGTFWVDIRSNKINVRRVFGLSNGETPFIASDGSVIQPYEPLMYPIPIPPNATSVNVSVTPSTQYIEVSLIRFDGQEYKRDGASASWVQNQTTMNVTPETYPYLAVATKYDSAGTSYPTEPTDLVVEFSE